jgi:alkylation response protein AidB-like acyl-CoA dehydrogenase
VDLTYNEEQRLLAEAADRFVKERYGFEARRAVVQSEEGFSRAIWSAFADLGWLGLSIAEEHGGLSAGAVEAAILMEAFGSALVVEPYVSTVVIGAGLVGALASANQKAELLPPVVEGKSLLAFAHSEPKARFALEDVATKAKRAKNGWRISGRKEMVIGGPSADTLLVSARIAGKQQDRAGIGVFALPAKQRGIASTNFPTLDGGRASHIVLDNAEVGADALLGGSDGALPAIEATVDRAIAALAAEAVGAMQVLLDITIAYTKQRVQFGRPIADNQVLRHRMAAMAVRLEEARASALKAAILADAEPLPRALAASSTKAKVGRAGRFVAEQAVQLHGGMGVTEELSVGAYFKRLMAIEILFGSPDHHLARHAKLSRLAAEAA